MIFGITKLFFQQNNCYLNENGHSGECTPLLGRLVHILYSTDRPDLDSDLHQNLILFLPPNQFIHQVSSESFCNFLRYHAMHRFSPITQWWRITWIHIQIFTKIESILSHYKPNLPTKFHLNLSTTFSEILQCRFLAPSLNGKTSLKTLSVLDPDSDIHQNLIFSFVSNTQVLQ